MINFITKRKFKLLFSGLLLLISSNIVQAQNSSPDSTDFAFLPAISYNSDFGLIAGGVTSWYNYRDNVYPFYSYVNFSGIISTKGLASFSFLVDKPYAFNRDLRITTEVFLARFFEDAYYGIGNYQKIENPPDGLPKYFEFQSFTIGFRNNARFPIWKGETARQLDVNLITNFRYETPWENGDDRLITLDSPIGINGGRTSMLGAGLIWESRDSEFQPTKGNYLETRFELGNTIWGSNFNMSAIEIDLRHYYSFFLLKEVTFAIRLQGEHTNGDVPYWKKAYAGDEETLRGYNSRRFSDDNVLILNSELRTWLFQVPETNVRIGGTLFSDYGRTFSNDDSIDIVFEDPRITFGFGGLITFFTPDFIIRGDFGFSDEGMGIYFTTGFMF